MGNLLTVASDLEFLGRQADQSGSVSLVYISFGVSKTVASYITSKTVASAEC